MNLLGAYNPGSSLLHRLDAGVRVIVFSLFAASILLLDGYGFIIWLAMLLLLYRASGVPILPQLRSIGRFRAFFITVFLMNAFFQPSSDSFFSWWIITFSWRGIAMGLRMVISVILMVVLSSLLTAVATPVSIADGLRTVLHPLSFIGIPVDQAAMIVSAAISFIPVLASESESILLACRSRGAVPEGKNSIARARSLVPLVLPVFLAAFRRADELSLAMEARGYRGEKGRTRRKGMHVGKAEIIMLLSGGLMLSLSIIVKGVL